MKIGIIGAGHHVVVTYPRDRDGRRERTAEFTCA